MFEYNEFIKNFQIILDSDEGEIRLIATSYEMKEDKSFKKIMDKVLKLRSNEGVIKIPFAMYHPETDQNEKYTMILFYDEKVGEINYAHIYPKYGSGIISEKKLKVDVIGDYEFFK